MRPSRMPIPMPRVRRWATTVMLALLLSSPAIAGRVLRVTVQEDSAPKFVIAGHADRGAVEGVCPDILRAIEQLDPGIRFVFEPHAQPLRRIVMRMEQADVDANCLINNDERGARLQVVGLPLFSFDYFLIARANDGVHIGNWDDVRRLGPEGRILTISGTGAMERLRKLGGLTVEESGKSATANLRKLVRGRGRFFYYRVHDWTKQVHQASVAGQVQILPTRMETVRFHLMLGRHVEPATVVRLERAVQQLAANGTLANVRAKWQLGPGLN